MAEQLLREDKKEILPILDDKKVLDALAKFLWVPQYMIKEVLKVRLQATQKSLVTLRGTDVEKDIHHWYYSFSIPKSHDLKEFRTISAPFAWLKQIQNALLQNLRQIPVSHAVQGGELWTSPKKNALHHRPSTYLYTTDIESAYPSVSAKRVFKNIQGWLGTCLHFSFPHLSASQREAFFNVLTTLTTHHNALPQWAPTSARLLNIVMAQTDRDLQLMLQGEQSPVTKPVYTRYIDDIAISFKHFSSFDHFWQEGKRLLHMLDTACSGYQNGFMNQGAILGNVAEVTSFLEHPYQIADASTRDRMRQCYLLIKEKIVLLRDNPKTKVDSHFYNSLYKLIGDIDNQILLINTSPDQAAFVWLQANIKKIVNANGRTLKHAKDKVWMPGSPTVKEITWVMIWPDWRIGISQDKMEAYVSLAKTATLFPSQLNKKYLQVDGSVDWLQLAYVLHGIRNFIQDVKGHVPAYFERRFLWAQAKHFPKVKVAKNVQSMKWVSNGGV